MGVAAKNILIGIFVIIAIAIIVFILLFLHPTVGDNAKTLRVRFTNIEKITIGTRVTYAGKPVGEVISIRELPDARTERVARNGDVYVYELVLKVDSGVSVYNTDTISTYTSGLLGERGIEINPEPLQKDEKLVLIENEILYANPARSLEETLQQFERVALKVGKVLDNIDETINDIRKEEIVAETGKTVRHAREIAETLNKPDKWNAFMDNMLAFSKHINESMTTVDDTLGNLKTASTSAKDIMNYISEGRGSLGKVIVDEELYMRMKATFGKADNVFDDIKNYGILFQNNKRWQRMNAQRRNLLGQLSNPETFNAYFSNQIQQASNSLSEVNKVMQQQSQFPKSSSINNPNFTKNYGQLLKQVDNLNDDCKMYNQQVIDQGAYFYEGQ